MWEESVGVIEGTDEECQLLLSELRPGFEQGKLGKKAENFIASSIISIPAVEGEGRQSEQSYNNDLRAWGMTNFIW
jgi:hypothetical protein